MQVISVSHAQLSQNATWELNAGEHYLFFLSRNRLVVCWNRQNITAADGCQVFLRPQQKFFISCPEKYFFFDLVEFMPEQGEDFLNHIAFPETFCTPPHLVELSMHIAELYKAFYTEDAYRMEKCSLLCRLLIYSFAPGLPDGEMLRSDVFVDNTRSYTLSYCLQLPSAKHIAPGEWAGQATLFLDDSTNIYQYHTETQRILLGCEPGKTLDGLYVLGLSIYCCRDGAWGDRIFKQTLSMPSPITDVQLQYSYDAARGQVSWRVTDTQSGRLLQHYLTPPAHINGVLASSRRLHCALFLQPFAISVTDAQLCYMGESTPLPLHFTGGLSQQSASKTVKRNLLRLRAHISDHPEWPWTVAQAAALLHLSQSRFSHLYKEYFGMSFLHDVIRVRVKRSCAFLISGDQPITQIALALGYRDAKFFYRQFKHETGLSAAEYRQLYHKPQ